MALADIREPQKNTGDAIIAYKESFNIFTSDKYPSNNETSQSSLFIANKKLSQIAGND